jgi:hypothetical protein
METNSFQNMYSIFAVTNKHTVKLHHVGSLYIFCYFTEDSGKQREILKPFLLLE